MSTNCVDVRYIKSTINNFDLIGTEVSEQVSPVKVRGLEDNQHDKEEFEVGKVP